VYDRTYYATHPDMMECVSNEELRDRYLVDGLFREGEIILTYSHGERFIIGGAIPGQAVLELPRQQEPASAAGHSSACFVSRAKGTRRTAAIDVRIALR